jgi:cytochrome c biogenesis protein CcmG/thiol:disulfide interchange protein DsbE
LLAKLQQHMSDGMAIVGVLTDDPEEPARQFVAEYHATWPTVVDPSAAIKRSYRVVARPHSWFIDRNGILRSQQIGELTDADFERQYARIAR